MFPAEDVSTFGFACKAELVIDCVNVRIFDGECVVSDLDGVQW